MIRLAPIGCHDGDRELYKPDKCRGQRVSQITNQDLGGQNCHQMLSGSNHWVRNKQLKRLCLKREEYLIINGGWRGWEKIRTVVLCRVRFSPLHITESEQSEL